LPPFTQLVAWAYTVIIKIINRSAEWKR
jgi:hypothetical protein